MKQEQIELIEQVCMDWLFKRRCSDADVLTVLNTTRDHSSTRARSHKNGYLTLSYCGRCSTIVAEGDNFCSYCGRELKW